MESADENFNSCSKESLLHNDQQASTPKHTRNKHLKRISFFLLILVILIAGSIILSSISKTRESQPLDQYLSGSDQSFCRLTMYPDLCYESMYSILNTTESLKTNPRPIFSSSIRASINELKSLSGPGLSKCGSLIRDSVSRLNESLCTLGVDSDVESLTYEEVDNIKAWISAAANNTLRCLLALEEIDNKGVEEMTLGVEKAREHMVNSIGLLDERESILFDFYNPSIQNDVDYYDHFSYSNFDYGFYIFLYSALYLFLALLYFLFWRSK